MTVKNGVIYGDALSAQEKKRIVMQKKKDRKAKKVRKSAQQTIPYVEMCRDGICKVNSRLYTKSIAFEDINYQLAQNEDKTAIFENWCDFLNYFDSSIFVQLSFINQKASLNEFRKRINIPAQEDAFNDIRSEYSGMLQSQLTKGNNGLVKKKYITFGIEADSLRTAKPKLERIETDILNNFKTLGVRTEPLSGYERLKVLHDVFNMDTNEPFRFSFDMVARTGLSTKDFIAPTSFDFREGKCFKMGKTIGAASFLQILAPELNDRMLADFLEMDSNITVNFHIRTIDQAKAIKSIKMKITDLHLIDADRQRGHQPLFLLEVKTLERTVVLLSDGGGLKDRVFELLAVGCRVHDEEGHKEQSLIAGLEILQQTLRLTAKGGEIGRDDVHVVAGADCLFLLFNLHRAHFL